MFMSKYVVLIFVCLLRNCNGFTLSNYPSSIVTTTRSRRRMVSHAPPFFSYQRINNDRSLSTISQLQMSISSWATSYLPSKVQSFIQLPFIGPSDTWGNIAAMAGTASIAQYLGKTTKVGKLLGPPVTAMAIAFALASIGILNPGGTIAAKSLQLLTLQLATPLLLLGADLRDCTSRCGPLLQAFLAAAFGTLVASIVGWKICGKALQNALGVQDGLIIAAALMAKNIGGGINYIAVCRSLSASSPAIAAGLCVDNLFALAYFPITSALSAGRPDLSLDRSTTSSRTGPSSVDDDTKSASLDESTNAPITDDQDSALVSIEQASMVLFLAALATWLGERLGGPTASLPVCTLLTVLFASRASPNFIRPLQPAAHVMGTVCLYLFFATAGAPGIAVAESVRASLLPLGSFLTILYGVHGSILTLCYKWSTRQKREKANINTNPFVPQRLLVASSAAIGGPATAAALAQANKWESLVVPSLLVGNIGYAIATFAGLAFVALNS